MTSKAELLARLDEICRYVEAYEDTHKYAPTVREIAIHLEVSVNTAHRSLVTLRRSGRVNWVEGDSRTLHVTGGS